MRIGFDATALTMARTGIGRYTLELLRALVSHEPGIDIRLMAHRPLDPGIRSNGLASLAALRGPGFPVKLVWMQALLPVELAASGVDLCHFTNYHAPIATRRAMVVNVHDTSLLSSPARHPAARAATMGPLLRTTARRAAAVICLTESARRDVLAAIDLDADRVHVIPAAPASIFRPIDDDGLLASVAARYRLPRGFVLFVGTIEPRKNLLRLVEAYARLRGDGFAEPLVLAGQLGWKYDALLRRIEELRITDAVRFTGYVPDADLPPLMNLCGAFVYPSLYEGFGLPVIEALACGAPTVTSDRGALSEVAGDAALLADPEDVDSLTRAIGAALGDAPVRARLRDAGPGRAAAFGWDRAASKTVEVYRGALGGRVGS